MEEWAEIEGYDGRFFISNLGNIKGVYSGKEKPCYTYLREGYLAVQLSKNHKRKVYSIHMLVAKYFIPNPDNKPVVNHLDCVKTNNRADNLEWATYSENTIHSINNGLITIRFWQPKGYSLKDRAKPGIDYMHPIKRYRAARERKRLQSA